MLDNTLEERVALTTREAQRDIDGLLNWIKKLGAVAIEERDKAVKANALEEVKTEIANLRRRNARLKQEIKSARGEYDTLQAHRDEGGDREDRLEDERDEARAALAELVRLKDLHDCFDGFDAYSLTADQLAGQADYVANKPKAWAEARRIVNLTP